MTASSVTIEEVTPNGRKVVLIGPSLPFQGAAWGGTNRLSTNFNPGNGVSATQHVLGPTEKPSSWEGVFRRTLMGKTPSTYTDESGVSNQIVSPVILRDLLESIFRRGFLLRVTWTQTRASDGVPFSTERLGRCADWDFPHDRIEDIAWKAEFHWISRGNEQQNAVAIRESDLQATFVKLDISMNELSTQVQLLTGIQKQGIKFPNAKLTLGQLQALANAPTAIVKSVTDSLQRNVNKIRDAVGVAQSFRKAPYDIINTVLASAKNSIATANQAVDELSAIPPEASTVKSNVSDITRATTYFGESQGRIRDVARQSAAAQLDFVSSANTSQVESTGGKKNGNNATPTITQSVYISKAGDTPQTISIKFYGNPSGDVSILQSNNLPLNTIALPTGKILIIPSNPNTTASKGATV